jgi:hypothetical protein
MCSEAVCVSCGKNVKLDGVHVLFKTGFYKARYPLSVCLECHGSKSSEAVVISAHTEEIVEWSEHAKVGV